jgi:IPT/TIG domain
MKIRLLVLSAAILLCMIFCSKDSTGPDTELSPIEFVNASLAMQSTYGDLLFSMFSNTDTSIAVKSILSKIQSETDFVDSAWINSQGIAVEYKNGMRGGIMYDPEDHYAENMSQSRKLAGISDDEEYSDDTPGSIHTLFLCPIYSEKQIVADSIISVAQASFQNSGYRSFTKYVDQMCGIERFLNLDNNGLIHIYSHSFAWPEKDAVSEVYLMTGDTATSGLNSDYLAQINNSQLTVFYLPEHGNTYFLAPSFLKDDIDLSDDNPLFYLDFGHSFSTGWQNTLIDDLGAGACIGYDWNIRADSSLSWTTSMYSLMGDTSQFKQASIDDWYNSIDPSYQDGEYTASILYDGPSEYYLWYSLRITELSSTSGYIGDTISIHGVGFGDIQGDGSVTFSSQSAGVVSWSDSLIVAIVPDWSESNDVIVRSSGLTSNRVGFEVLKRLYITEINPIMGSPGDTISIKGYGFGEIQDSSHVMIHGVDASVVSWTDTLILATVPENTSTGSIIVYTSNEFSNSIEFELIIEPSSNIRITSIHPDAAYYDDTLTIVGRDFGNVPGRVYFGSSYRSSFVLWSDTKIQVTVHSGIRPGTYDLKVFAGGYFSNTTRFTRLPECEITSIEPTWVQYGDTLTIHGNGFDDPFEENYVSFSGPGDLRRHGEIIFWSDTLINVIIPESSVSGDIYANINYWSKNSSNRVHLAVFGLADMDLKFAVGGAIVHLTGSEFGDTQLPGSVRMGSIYAAIHSWSDTDIYFYVPNQASSSEVMVTKNHINSTTMYLKIPIIHSVTPSWTAPGDTVTVRGIDFGTDTHSFSFYYGATVKNILEWTNNSITGIVPENAQSGVVTVNFPGRIKTYYHSVDVLSIKELNPNWGSPGDTIRIVGSGYKQFQDYSYVTFNGVEADVIEWYDSLILVTVPDDADSGDVIVHVDGLQSTGVNFAILELADIFEYLHQCTYVEVTFSGYITIQPERFGTKFRTFVVSNSSTPYYGYTDYHPIEWNTNNLSYGYIDRSAYLYSYSGAFGAITPDGERIDSLTIEAQEAAYMDGPGVPAWCHTYRYGFVIHDLPITNLEIQGSIIISAEISGAEVQNYISDITLLYHYWVDSYYPYDGIDQTVWLYDSIDFDNEEYPPTLRVVFKSSP